MKNQDQIYKLLITLKVITAERKLLNAKIKGIKDDIDSLVSNKELEFSLPNE